MIYAIDSHQHFWDPARGDYSWMTDAHRPIAKVFAPADLEPVLAENKVSHSILVQTWSSVDETREFLALAEKVDFVAGVVGWVDLTADDVGATLDQLQSSGGGHWLKGIRHQVHDEADPDWLRRDDVMRGLAEVQRRGLVYDLLLRPREIAAAKEVVAAFPDMRFVIDHIAKPDIANDGFASWAAAMEGFADLRHNVWCKLSGMVTEDEWSSRDDTRFLPYVNEVMTLFGTERAMYGSDWPVCLLAGPYDRTLNLLRYMFRDQPAAATQAILRENAIAAYRLQLTPSPGPA